MCGFAGYVSFEPMPDAEQRRSVLETMGGLLARRGPDDQQIYQHPHLDFVFRRLSIIDVDGGDQPIWNGDETVFVAVNGEIYNHQELRAELPQDTGFRTRSDSEVLLHLYLQHGPDALARLNGMFAACIWIPERQELFLARDRLGIKPLYVAQTGSGMLFGSELKALLAHPACPRQVDWWDVGRTGVEERSRVATYVRGLEHLQPGHYAHVKGGSVELQRYWRLEDHLWTPERPSLDAAAYVDEYDHRIETAVTRRLMSDVPVGIFLSGGVDSSLITAIASSHSPGINAFTAVERTTFLAGDVEASRLVAARTDIEHHLLELDTAAIGENFDLKRFEAMIALIESPRFEFEWEFKARMHHYAASAVPDLKVILLGQGADEFAGGYSHRHGTDYPDWNSYIEHEVRPTIRKAMADESRINGRWESLLDPNAFPPDSEYVRSPYHQKMLALCNQLQHFNLWHEDRSSAFHGIEARVPYLDHELVEFLAGIPPALHPELFWDKKIVRAALQRRIPDYPADRPKIGFYYTNQRETINDLYRRIVLQVYPEFIDRYEDELSEIYSLDAVEALHAKVGESAQVDDALFQLLDLMAAVVFQAMVNDVVSFTAATESKASVPDRIDDQRLAQLGEAYRSYRSPNLPTWTMETSIRLAPGVEFLRPLSGDDQRIVVRHDGQAAHQFSVPESAGWIVTTIGMLDQQESSPVGKICQTVAQPPQAVVGFLEQLLQRGFVRIAT